MSAAVVVSLYGLARHALTRLLRDLGARSAGRACLTAATREAWQEIADDVRSLARHDLERSSYQLGGQACEAMGRGDAAAAVDLLLHLTGDDLPEWLTRAEEARASLSGGGAVADDCLRLDAAQARLSAIRDGWVRSGLRSMGEIDALRTVEFALEEAAAC